MGKIYIIGMGPGDVGDLTLEAIERAESGIPNFIRTKEHPVIEFFYDKGIEFISFDDKYKESSTFEDVYSRITEELILEASKGDINYWTPGNPMVAESVVKKLLDEDLDIEIVSGISFLEPVLELVERDLVDGLQVLDALTFDILDININMDTIITQVYNSRVISETKLTLSEVYGDEYLVKFIQNAGVKGREILREVPIYELDRIEEPNLLTSLYIPRVGPENKNIYNMQDIFELVEILKRTDIHPWNEKLSHESIKDIMVREAENFKLGIEADNYQELIDSLGNILFQVVLHTSIGYDDGMFTFHSLTDEIGKKLVREYPDVF